MKEQVKHTYSKMTGNNIYYIHDDEKGVPYTSVTVNDQGNYWFLVYGSFCFAQPSHDKILNYIETVLKIKLFDNITVEKWQASRK